MKCYSWKICAVVLLVVAVAVSAKKKTKYEGDFEFVDEVSAKRDDKEGAAPLVRARGDENTRVPL